jgi:endoglucanase
MPPWPVMTLLNEPSETFPGGMGPEVVNLYDRLYQAIRKIDPDHIIIMEAIWWWNTLPNPQEKNWGERRLFFALLPMAKQ